MRDLFQDEFICYNYFRDNNITSREQLRKYLKEKPLKEIRQAIIETFFSDYKKHLKSKKPKDIKAKKYKVACINDLHIPYHDDRVIKLVFDCIVDNQPNQLVLNGDVLDCYHMSDFIKDPSNNKYMQHECDTFYSLFSYLRKYIPNTKIIYVLGNHEDRVERQINKNPQFFGIQNISIPELLRCKDLDIQVYKKKYVLKDFLFIHGNKSSSRSSYTAKAEFEDHKCRNGISAHTHRLGSYHQTYDQEVTSWYENGCLCTLNPDYIKDVVNWQHGFSFIDFYKNTNQVTQILIKDYKFTYNGVIYE